MKKLSAILISLLIFAGTNHNSFAQTKDIQHSTKPVKLWETPNVLTTSESVCYDAVLQVLYVSCINGNPVEKDQSGFIAKLSPDGNIVVLKWITGLNAPKGMGIYGDKLYVTDIDRIVEIDIKNSAIIKDYPVDKAKFLNDITIDPEGNVFVSDMSTGKIHRLSKGVVDTWLKDKQIGGPNGLLYEDKEILIGTRAGIYSVRMEDKKIWHLVKDTGGIDGLIADGKGNYIISDWMGKIQLVNPEKDPVVLLNTTDDGINAADIEFNPVDNILYVPTFGDNRVVAYELINDKN